MTITSSTATVTVNAGLSSNSLVAQSGNTIQVYSQVSVANKIVTGLATPSAVSDAVPKTYADSAGALVANFKPFWSVYSTAVTLSAGSFAYITSTSNLSMADSTNSLKAPVGNLLVCLTANSNSNITAALGPCEVGFYASLTTGGEYFLDTHGGLTSTMPSAASTIVYVVGTARSAATLFVNPVYLGSNAT